MPSIAQQRGHACEMDRWKPEDDYDSPLPTKFKDAMLAVDDLINAAARAHNVQASSRMPQDAHWSLTTMRAEMIMLAIRLGRKGQAGGAYNWRASGIITQLATALTALADEYHAAGVKMQEKVK